MKNIAISILLLFFYVSCISQFPIIKDMSRKTEMNYIFARISSNHIINKELFGGGLYATIYYLSDSKKTPENFSEGTEEFLVSYLVSISPDGDYYDWSKLFKIEGLVYPEILEVREKVYPKFEIIIEHGFYDKRKTEIFEFEGVQ